MIPMIRVRQKLSRQEEQVAVLPRNEAQNLRLKYQFQLLIKGVRMVDVDGTDRHFRLIRNGEIVGYFYMESVH